MVVVVTARSTALDLDDMMRPIQRATRGLGGTEVGEDQPVRSGARGRTPAERAQEQRWPRRPVGHQRQDGSRAVLVDDRHWS
jgi:hypothetical protein